MGNPLIILILSMIGAFVPTVIIAFMVMLVACFEVFCFSPILGGVVLAVLIILYCLFIPFSFWIVTATNIDKIFEENDKIKIIIPKDIYSITPSFLEEYFYNVVKKYGKNDVESRLEWETNGYSINEALSEAFERILRRINGLDK